jgi:hypothetical protein
VLSAYVCENLERLNGVPAMKEERAVPSKINSKELSAKLTPNFFLHKFLAQSISCFVIVLLYEAHEAPIICVLLLLLCNCVIFGI